MSITPENVRLLVDLLGEVGAQAGLEQSFLTVAELREVLSNLGRQAPARAKRKDLVIEIIFGATQKIDRTSEELFSMNADELLEYFESKKPSRSELLKLLGELDFHPGSEAQKSLYKYAARQIAETGMFQRVAKQR